MHLKRVRIIVFGIHKRVKLEDMIHKRGTPGQRKNYCKRNNCIIGQYVFKLQ